MGMRVYHEIVTDCFTISPTIRLPGAGEPRRLLIRAPRVLLQFLQRQGGGLEQAGVDVVGPGYIGQFDAGFEAL